jgi:hypothetical protein
MADKKHVYEAKVMGLPPLRLVLGDIPVPATERHHQAGQKQQKMDRKMEGTVKRLIAHLKENWK